MSEAVTVTATRWSGGWELEIDENHHTQVGGRPEHLHPPYGG